MKKLDVSQTISIIANVGVIAGIAFLAIEVRQNNELMADEAVRARADSIRQGYSQFVETPELTDIYIRERNGEALTEAEAFRMGAHFMRGLVGYQTAFQQLPREALDAYKSWWRLQARSNPSFRSAWAEWRVTFQPGFVEFMEENVVNR